MGEILRQAAGWMPQQDALEKWLAALRRRADARRDRPLHPAISEFQALIDSDPVTCFASHYWVRRTRG